MKEVIRWVVTHINQDGIRIMSCSCQGRNTYATKEEAAKWIENMLANNNQETINAFGIATSFEPRRCECYPVHFDPIRLIYREEDLIRMSNEFNIPLYEIKNMFKHESLFVDQ